MIIGREKEQQELREAYLSDESKFVAVYGRRRVGKTYLVRQTFKDSLTFSHSGQAKGSLAEQLFGWKSSLKDAGYDVSATPSSWLEAFDMLKDLIRKSAEKKKVVFIDEMPWLDTPRSNFVNALEFFWNGWASGRDDVLLIVCGSATSWIVNKLFRNHGGLHNRVTNRIYLQPFTLHECELFMQQRGLSLTRYDIIEGYMILGGIPFYWSFLERGKSLAQNIDSLVFAEDGKLRYEFSELYNSLFRNPDNYIKVVLSLGQCQSGLTREEIINKCGMASSGTLTTVIEDLENCGFIRKVAAFGRKSQQSYMLIDNFTLFYLKFIKKNTENDESFWSHSYQSPLRRAWVGIAFERVCFQHLRQIRQALGIGGVVSSVYSLNIPPTELHRGAQIDMIIDRADNMVNICEMKYSNEEYVVTKDDALSIANKTSRLLEVMKKRKSVAITIVTVYGIAHTGYWNNVQNVVTADNLFME
ncbi:MAG: ATP-binding protein [Prevotella sp.]